MVPTWCQKHFGTSDAISPNGANGCATHSIECGTIGTREHGDELEPCKEGSWIGKNIEVPRWCQDLQRR